MITSREKKADERSNLKKKKKVNPWIEKKFQRLNVETSQDKKSVQCRGDSWQLALQWKQMSETKMKAEVVGEGRAQGVERSLWVFGGKINETTIEIGQEIVNSVSSVRIYSKKYSGKALVTKAGIFWWQLLWCLEEVKHKHMPRNIRDCIQRSLKTVHNLIAFHKLTSVFLPKSK